MENITDTPILSPKGTFPATVVLIIDGYKLAINKGEIDGIREGQRFLIYQFSDEEITDPNTGEPLGRLEIVKGTGKVVHLQQKMSIIESDKKQIYRQKLVDNNPFSLTNFSGKSEVVEYDQPVPFENPKINDLVKPI